MPGYAPIGGQDSHSLNGSGQVDTFNAANHRPPGGLTAKDMKNMDEDGFIRRKVRRGPLTRLRDVLRRTTS